MRMRSREDIYIKALHLPVSSPSLPGGALCTRCLAETVTMEEFAAERFGRCRVPVMAAGSDTCCSMRTKRIRREHAPSPRCRKLDYDHDDGGIFLKKLSLESGDDVESPKGTAIVCTYP